MSGPCEWGLSYAECTDTAVLNSLWLEVDKATVETMAVEYLWNWTGRQFGLCEVSIRPCRADCVPQSTFVGASWLPVLIGGQWQNVVCGTCGHRCDCADGSTSIRLPGPIATVEEVLVDGAVLPPQSYRVDNKVLLVRLDGQAWPRCQDLTLAASESGTWQVTYTYGTPVPEGGKIAAGLLATEFAKALCNDNTCRLPQRVQSVTRQGVTMAVLDSFEDLSQGRTGIWLVDSWVASVSSAPLGRSQVFSPDVPRHGNRKQTWPSA